MVSILKDLGIMEYEPRVLNQLLEFAYRYMTTILDDAKMVSSHAKKKAVDVDDIKLAVQVRLTLFQCGALRQYYHVICKERCVLWSF